MSPTIKILFEDEHLIIVDKPSGIHSIRNENSEEGIGTLSDLLIEKFPPLKIASEFPGDGGLIQRLDFGTSGCIIAARSRGTWNHMREMIKLGRIRKSYLVVLQGTLSSPAELNTYLGSPNRGAPKVRIFTERPRKKDRALPASSQFIPLRSVADSAATLCRVVAPTARRHQIRAHASYLGYPLVGDQLYGATASLKEIFNFEVPGGFILHAERVEFIHPVTDKTISVESAFPFQI